MLTWCYHCPRKILYSLFITIRYLSQIISSKFHHQMAKLISLLILYLSTPHGAPCKGNQQGQECKQNTVLDGIASLFGARLDTHVCRLCYKHSFRYSAPHVGQFMHYTNYFFFSLLGDMGVQLSHNSLRDGARAVLNLIPADAHTSTKIRTLCTDLVKNPASNPQHGFDSLYFTTSPSQTLYNLDVCYR